MSTEANRKLVIEFFETMYDKLEFDKADRFLAPNCIEHNPDIGDGLENFKKNTPTLLAGTQKGTLKIVRSVAEGNMVVLHSRLPIGGKEYAIADFYRVEGGKIVEHWDVLQEMLPSETNPHPYF